MYSCKIKKFTEVIAAAAREIIKIKGFTPGKLPIDYNLCKFHRKLLFDNPPRIPLGDNFFLNLTIYEVSRFPDDYCGVCDTNAIVILK